MEDQDGIIWLGTPDGVLLYDPTTDKITEFQRDIINRNITGITSDHDGNVYITTNNHLFMWRPSRRTLTRLTPDEGVWEITHSFMDKDGLKYEYKENAQEGHSWATWRADLQTLAPTLFK